MDLRCDFHVHSTVSDGTLAPGEIASLAHETGVDTLALTDHDEIAGVAEAARRGSELGVEVIAGIEFSVTEDEGRRQMHILGLGIDPDFPALRECVAALRSARVRRSVEILERLREVGIHISRERLAEIAGEGSIGRPHVARALVEAGVCASMDEAFGRFLRRGRPAFIAHPGLPSERAISLIHAAGGIASLAHPPSSLGVQEPGGLELFVERLVATGLDGLEVWHPSQHPGQTRKLGKLARKWDLVPTGGSDFHGADRPDVKLGRGRGRLRLGRSERDRILDRIAQVRVPGGV
ncbi:MAG: PHP domain-containing protein [Myxococcota bacterium]